MESKPALSLTRTLRANASTIIALTPPPCPDARRPAIEVPTFDNVRGIEARKAKYHFIREALEESLAAATDDPTAKLCFTDHWKYNNCSQAVVVGWPAGIKWDCISTLPGRSTAYNILLKLLKLGSLYVRVATTVEWADHQADGACQGFIIWDEPSDTAPRRDRCIRRPKCHVRKKLRPVQRVPKSPEFVEDSDVDADIDG